MSADRDAVLNHRIEDELHSGQCTLCGDESAVWRIFTSESTHVSRLRHF